MLRVLVLALALANLGFFAWTRGWLDPVTGVRALGDREPERLQRQLQPEKVQLLPPQAMRPALPAAAGAASLPGAGGSGSGSGGTVGTGNTGAPAAPPAAAPAASIAAAAPTLACLEAGPFIGAEAATAEAVLRAALPEGSWVALRSGRPGLWMVYLGRFKDREEQVRRQDELRALRVEYDELRSPAELVPGVSLGRFEERANAVNAQEQFALRGIRAVRVIEARSPASSVLLRVDKAPPALAALAAGLNAPALGKGFAPCGKVAGN